MQSFIHTGITNNVLSPYFRIYLIDEGEGYISGQGKKLIPEQSQCVVPTSTNCPPFSQIF